MTPQNSSLCEKSHGSFHWIIMPIKQIRSLSGLSTNHGFSRANHVESLLTTLCTRFHLGKRYSPSSSNRLHKTGTVKRLLQVTANAPEVKLVAKPPCTCVQIFIYFTFPRWRHKHITSKFWDQLLKKALHFKSTWVHYCVKPSVEEFEWVI